MNRSSRADSTIARCLAGSAALVLLAALGSLASPSYPLAAAEPLPPTTRLWGALTGDFDGRNGLDVVLIRHWPDRTPTHGKLDGIYFSDGSGGWALGFTFPGADRHGCTSGDVNADGLLDLYCEIGAELGTARKANELWIQQVDGGFEDEAAAWGVTDPFGRGRRALLYDHTGDGLVDLYSTVWGERPDGERNENRFYINRGNRFVERLGPATGRFAAARCVGNMDWNGDGRQDLFLCSDTLRLFKNAGGGGHQDVSFLTGKPVTWPKDVQAADLNNDRLPDLIVVFNNRIEIRLNLGGGYRFSTVTKSIPVLSGQRALVRDLTGDGRFDIYVTEGCVGGVDQVDALLVGPGWTKKAIGERASMGCGNEVVDAGKLIVFNGTDATEGSVVTLTYPLAAPPL